MTERKNHLLYKCGLQGDPDNSAHDMQKSPSPPAPPPKQGLKSIPVVVRALK